MKKEKFKYYIFVIMIVLIMILMLSYTAVNAKDYIYSRGNNNILSEYKNIKTQKNETYKIEQVFVAKYNNLEHIYIQFSKCENANYKGYANIIVTDSENNNVIFEKQIATQNLAYSTKYKVNFESQKESKGKEYKISIEYIKDEAKSYAYIPTYHELQETNQSIVIDGIEVSGMQLNFTDCYLNKDSLKTLVFSIIIVSLIVIIIAIYIINAKKITTEKAFMLIVPTFCILMTIAIPAGCGHDETLHFIREYKISEGELVSKNTVQIPVAIAEISKYDTEKNEFVDKSYSDLFRRFSTNINKNNLMNYNIKTAAVYNPLQYINSVVGILIGKLITNQPEIIVYFGRIFNIIVSVTIIYFAIKIIPFGKKILLIASFIPIVVEGFSTLSPDGLAVSISFLLIAYVLKLAFVTECKKITRKNRIILTVLSCIVACCKIVYIPLILLMWIIPKEKFENGKDKNKKLLTINVIPTLISTIWLLFSFSILSSRSGESSKLIINALSNPINFVQRILYTINIYSNEYIMTGFGKYLEYNELVNIQTIAIILSILTIITAIFDETIKEKFTNKQKRIIGITAFIIITLVFCSLYTQWTYSENITIEGVQGRYFIPILPLLIFLFGDLKIRTKYTDQKLIKCISIVGILIQLQVIITIVLQHI